MRPELPEGPYLVVGLARSGIGAAYMLAPYGEVIGVDSGRPEVDGAFEAHLESDGLDLLDRVRTVVKSPGVPPRAPVIAAARERGIPVLGELELAWRVLEVRQAVRRRVDVHATELRDLGLPAIDRDHGLATRREQARRRDAGAREADDEIRAGRR